MELYIWGDLWHKDSPQVAGSSVIGLDRKMADSVIPVVDFEIMGLNAEKNPPKDEESLRKLAEDIYTAFSTIGFVYLKNHGISDTEVNYWPVVYIPRRKNEGRCYLPT